MKKRINLFIATIFAAFLTTTHAGPSNWSGWTTNLDNRVTTLKAAEDCCKPGRKVALVCKDCKTLDVKDGGKEKKGILAWFVTDSKHGCSGCGGTLTVNYTGGGKGPTPLQSKHICSKCGPNSAYVCTDHKKS